MAQESISDLQLVDDFYFSALSNENQDQIFPISDSKYAEELQFQEALMGSIMASQLPNIAAAPLTIQASPESIPEQGEPTKEVGQSSHSFCEICLEKKEFDDMFRIDSCTHSYCFECINKHVATKIKENMRVVKCPGWDCKGVLEFDACRAMMSAEVVEKWDELVCESMTLETEKFHCPFRDCSAILVVDNDGEGIRECECPICHRLFCAGCYVPWHNGIECEEFRRLNEDERGREDLMVRELARSKRWKRCPNCNYYVERTEGCSHMSCRCGFPFCYACGGTWSGAHVCGQRP